MTTNLLDFLNVDYAGSLLLSQLLQLLHRLVASFACNPRLDVVRDVVVILSASVYLSVKIGRAETTTVNLGQ